MTNTKNEIQNIFGNKLRLRVCGICIQNDQILLAKHRSLGEKGVLWAPPGGGLTFGESAETSLKREFAEETGLEVEIDSLLFVHEFLEAPLHAIELFFEVKITGGRLKKGHDPELDNENQIIEEIRLFDFEEIQKEDPKTLHNIFTMAKTKTELLSLKGYYKYENSWRNVKKQ